MKGEGKGRKKNRREEREGGRGKGKGGEGKRKKGSKNIPPSVPAYYALEPCIAYQRPFHLVSKLQNSLLYHFFLKSLNWLIINEFKPHHDR